MKLFLLNKYINKIFKILKLNLIKKLTLKIIIKFTIIYFINN